MDCEEWRENASRWRQLYLDLTFNLNVGHNPRTVQAEYQYHKLVEKDEERNAN